MGSLNRINHIVVLMLENRSFDCLLGQLYPSSQDFNGLVGTEANPNPPGPAIAVWNQPGGTGTPVMTIPDPDPAELWRDMNQQICGSQTYNPPAPADAMSGFVASYMFQSTLPKNAGTPYDPRAVMHYFRSDQVPVISTLATSFAVSDAWFASAPCQTWPNRFFVHCATANGYENNEPFNFPYEMPTIFNRLQNAGQSWRVYFTDVPQSVTLSQLWLHLTHFHLYDEFKADAANGNLPAYAFIEPRYFPDLKPANDEHPPHDVRLGEQLIAEIYNSLRSGPGWNETLFIITCDEHGGCYDHVLPPGAPPPEPPRAGQAFTFDRFGVRVPAVLVSPFIPARSVVRAPPGVQPLDHTAIVKTLRDRFNLGGPLTQRDANAPSLDIFLTLASPDNQGPAQIAPPLDTLSLPEVARAQREPLNDLQRSLMVAAAHLPPAADAATVEAHIARLRSGETVPVERIESLVAQFGGDLLGGDVLRENARHFIKQRLNQLFGSIP